MAADPEDALELAALSEQAGDDNEALEDEAPDDEARLEDAALEDEALDDAAQGVSVTSDATADGTDETGEIDAIGRAAGLVVRDDKPFRGIDEVERRDEHRWELDPASAEDSSSRDDAAAR
jgi:hypothetical protein